MATITWTGAADDNWANPQNWSSAKVPQQGDFALISPNTPQSPRGADIITTVPGSNEIQGTKAELASITVTDFGPSDLFNVTDLTANTATVSFEGNVLSVFDDRTKVAAITLPGLAASSGFSIAPNNQGGSYISLAN